MDFGSSSFLYIYVGVLLIELMWSLLILGIGAERFPVVYLTNEGALINANQEIIKERHIGVNFLQRAQIFSTMAELLVSLNAFNKLAPSWEKEDTESLAWPGIIMPSSQHLSSKSKDILSSQDHLFLISDEDLGNLGGEGGTWVVKGDLVYDLNLFLVNPECEADKLRAENAGHKSPEEIFEFFLRDGNARHLLPTFQVGMYYNKKSFCDKGVDFSTISSPFVDIQRDLSLFLGLYCHSLVTGLTVEQCERDSEDALNMKVFSIGLEVRK